MIADHIQQCLDWFNAHVDHYADLAGPDSFLVQRKQRHTMRVLDHVHEILKESSTKPELAAAIEIATILHDVGRFPQIVGRGTFDDNAGLNHAEAGAQLLLDSDLLDPLPLDIRGVILSVVKYHNRAILPDNLGQDALRALEILRDADKLDAIRNNIKYLNPDAPHGKVLKSGLTWHKENYSEDVFKLALGRQLIPFKAINWSNDYILFLCCWTYDLHFTYSFQHLKDSGHFEKLLALLPDSEPFLKVKEQLRSDLDWIIVKSLP